MENRNYEEQEEIQNGSQLNADDSENERSVSSFEMHDPLYAADDDDDDRDDDQDDASGDWGDVDPQGPTGNEPTTPGSAV